jgi:outer membrane protein
MNKMTWILPAALACLSSGVQAQDMALAEAAHATKFVGLGVGYAPDFVGSEDYQAVPVPVGKFSFGSNRFVRFFGAQAEVNLLDMPNLYVGPALKLRGPRDEDVEDDVIAKMEEFEGGLEGGAFIEYRAKDPNSRNKITYKAKILTDMSDEYDGTALDLDVMATTELGPKADFLLGVGTTFADEDYMNGYFGVNTENRGTATTTELPDYKADSGLRDARVTVGALYYYNPNWMFGGTLRYMRLLGDAEDSPIVDKRGSADQTIVAFFAAYIW